MRKPRYVSPLAMDEAKRFGAELNAFLAQEMAKMRAEVERNLTRFLAPLVAREGGTVTISALELTRSWSLTSMESPDGGITLVAVNLDEQQVQ